MIDINSYVNGIMIRWVIITVFIVVNLILSIIEAIKLKNFDLKKLPKFAGEWAMSILVVSLVELIVISVKEVSWINSIFVGLREIILMSILGCYLKKMLESLKLIGWSVKVDEINEFIDDSTDILTDNIKNSLPLNNLTDMDDIDVWELNMKEHIDFSDDEKVGEPV